MSTIIQAIRIKLDKLIDQHTEIGLYTSSSSELRYSESLLTGVTTTYKNGHIISIGDVSYKGDFRQGGNQVQASDINIILSNSVEINNKLCQFNYVLEDLGISLIGQILEIIEFVGDESDSDSIETVNIFSGSIEEISWNETEFSITAKSSLSLRRNKYLVQKQGDKEIPCTFGTSNPDIGIFFKAIRTNEEIKKLTNSDISLSQNTSHAYPLKMSLYPVSTETFSCGSDSAMTALVARYGDLCIRTDQKSATTNTNKVYQLRGVDHSVLANWQEWTSPKYLIRLGWMDDTALPDERASYFVDKWAYCQSGASENQGQYRRIISASVYGSGDCLLEIEFDSFWSVNLAGNYAGTKENQTWLEIYDISKTYQIDSAPCKGFLNSSLVVTDKEVEIYAKSENTDNDEVIRLPDYGLMTDANDTDKNSLIVNPLVFDQEPTKLLSFLIVPVNSISRYTEQDLRNWNSTNETWWQNCTKYADGIYIKDTLEGATINNFSFTGSNTGDKNRTTYARFQYNVSTIPQSGQNGTYYFALKFDPVQLPSDFTFDKAYLGIRMSIKLNTSTDTYSGMCNDLRIMYRSYINHVNNVIQFGDKTSHDIQQSLNMYATQAWIDTLPDFYYLTDPQTKNKNFYVQNPPVGMGLLISGYKLLELKDVDKSLFENIEEFAIMANRYQYFGGTSFSDDIMVYDLAFIFEKGGDIKSDIFTRFSGRTYGDTWNNRKTASNVVSNYVDALELIKRSQDWSENSGTPLINTNSFDAVFNSRNDTNIIAHQELSYDKSSTDELTKSICSKFLLCSRQDENGKECIEDLITRQNPSTVITFGQILPDSIGDVIEASNQYVYTEPLINYGYDQATQKYKYYIRITKTDQTTYDASYVECNDPNYSSNDGLAWWTTCHNLRLKYKQFEAMPESLSNNDWVTTYASAKACLSNTIEWMTKKRNTLKVPYSIGRKYYEGMHLKIQLPHETNSESIECVIEEITKSKSKGEVSLKLILLDEPSNFEFFF